MCRSSSVRAAPRNMLNINLNKRNKLEHVHLNSSLIVNIYL